VIKREVKDETVLSKEVLRPETVLSERCLNPKTVLFESVFRPETVLSKRSSSLRPCYDKRLSKAFLPCVCVIVWYGIKR
jgi:hypothetical protein